VRLVRLVFVVFNRGEQRPSRREVGVEDRNSSRAPESPDSSH
jgi:hypothetical protein